MRFLRGILKDARRPFAEAPNTVRRNPSNAMGEDSFPPLAEQSGDANRVYRFQKEGAVNSSPRQVPVRGEPVGSKPKTGADVPLPEPNKRPGPMFAKTLSEVQTVSSDERLTKSPKEPLSDNMAKSATDREVIVRDKSDSLRLTVGNVSPVDESGLSNALSKEKLSIESPIAEAINDLDDLSTEQRQLETAPSTSMSSASARRIPGAGTPSEIHSDHFDSHPEPTANDPAQRPKQAKAEAQEEQQKKWVTSQSAPAQQTEAPPVQAERYRKNQSYREAQPPYRDAPSHQAPQAQSAPKVQIGQVDVVVFKQGRAEKPAQTQATTGRHLLSRSYLRRL